MKDCSKYSFYSGGLKGAETAFGENAEKWKINEVNFSFAGHKLTRENNVRILSDEELKLTQADKIRKVFQVIFHMVNKGFQVFAVGKIMEDGTVKGGTGWGVELAKFFNRPISVFDQETCKWYTWRNSSWKEDTPVIDHDTFCGTGTRNLTEEGKKAINDLFERSFR